METQTHTSNGNGATPSLEWDENFGEEETSLLSRPEVIAALAFAGGVLFALLMRRSGE